VFWKIVSYGEIKEFDESIVDHQPEQMALVQSGGPLEFTIGSIYHLGMSLESFIEQGSVPSDGEGVFFTRVPHKFLHFSFTRRADTPFIARVSSETFNRLASEGKACLEIWGGDRARGVIDPYPRTFEPLLLDDIEEIWVGHNVWARYQHILNGPSGLQERCDRLKTLSESGKVRLVGELSPIHGIIPDRDKVKEYLESRGLQYYIPAFRQRHDVR
jgi:hypothetical protein